jgi:hypothetical protein
MMGSDWAKGRAGRLLCGQPERPEPEFSAVSIGFLRESGAPHSGIGFAFS